MKPQPISANTATSKAFNLFLSVTALIAGLWIGTIDAPAAWALGVLAAMLAYQFAETLLALFVIFFPPGLFIAAVAGYLMR